MLNAILLNLILLNSAIVMSDNISELASQLQSDDPANRVKAAEALCRLGSEARAAAVPLAIAAGDEDEQVKQWASAALEELGPPDVADVAKLGDLLTRVESSADVGYWAATLLGRLEGDGQAAVPYLTKAAGEHFAMSVRERAVWALGKIGPAAGSAGPLLKELSSSDQPRLARLAKSSLGKIEGSAD